MYYITLSMGWISSSYIAWYLKQIEEGLMHPGTMSYYQAC